MLREQIAAKRDALSPSERADKSRQIAKRLEGLPEFQAASQALFYFSIKSEVDTAPMRAMARGRGMAVAAPRADQHDKRLTFYYVNDESGLEKGPYGILQPRQNSEDVVELEDASVIVVPGLVFDLKCNRLGWGAGFYDRFLGGEGRGIPSVGLAFDCQIVNSIPVEAHDMPVDLLLTESRVIRKNIR